MLNALPAAINTPELQLKTADGENFSLVERLRTEGEFAGAERDHHDRRRAGRVPDGFGLARPSNTTPVVVMRFEGETTAALERIQRDFGEQILKLKPDAQPAVRMTI